MKNNIFIITKYSYYLSVIFLVVLYFFPGSLIGYFLYGNLGTQPNFVSSPIGTSVNHLIYFSFITLLANIIRKKLINFFTSYKFILFLSIFLEFSHFIIPNRAFEFLDLFGNVVGVLLSITIFKLIK